jgi:RNA polymerase-binding transcription factor DksA
LNNPVFSRKEPLTPEEISDVRQIYEAYLTKAVETSLSASQSLNGFMDRNVSPEDQATQKPALDIQAEILSRRLFEENKNFRIVTRHLDLIKNGKFTGECAEQECDEIIPPARFRNNPAAELCVRCQSELEPSNFRSWVPGAFKKYGKNKT